MKRILIFAALACVVGFGTFGCGGSSSGTVTTSPYLGSYSGTFTTSKGQTGTAEFSVASNGDVSGTLHNNTTGQTGTINGSVDSSGNVNITSTYSSGSTKDTGTVSINPTTRILSGTLTEYMNGGVYDSITLQVMLQPTK